MVKKEASQEKTATKKNIKSGATISQNKKAKSSKTKAKKASTTKEITIRGKKATVIKKGQVTIIKMVQPKENKAREERIIMDYTVDCYGEEERAMGWYYSMEDKLNFPFMAKCIKERETSPLEVGDEVEVIEMASEDECQSEIFVKIRWEKRGLAVPLDQLKGVKVDKETKEAIEDWHYWQEMGYEY